MDFEEANQSRFKIIFLKKYDVELVFLSVGAGFSTLPRRLLNGLRRVNHQLCLPHISCVKFEASMDQALSDPSFETLRRIVAINNDQLSRTSKRMAKVVKATGEDGRRGLDQEKEFSLWVILKEILRSK